jgi:hypothetical protein
MFRVIVDIVAFSFSLITDLFYLLILSSKRIYKFNSGWIQTFFFLFEKAIELKIFSHPLNTLQ